MKQNKNERIKQVKDIISQIPEGRKTGYKRLILYRLGKKYNIVMNENQIVTFFSSGYSSVADEIIDSLKYVVDDMKRQEEEFKKLESVPC